MNALNKISQIRDFTEHELLRNILPYWMKYVPDNENGGFYGRITNNQQIDKNAEKGAILNARILYTFSAACLIYNNKLYKAIANRAYEYFLNHFIDKEYGGVFWSVDYKGNPLVTKKQFYALAFAIYALAEYFKINNDEKVLKEAIKIFNVIEEKAFDRINGGYIEALDRNWQPLADMRLSARDMNVAKSMNTHLHIIEAYTNLYRVYKDDKLYKRLIELYDIFRYHIIDSINYHLILFFDEKWNRLSDIISFGHDIEASWLLHEAALVAGDVNRIIDAENMALRVVNAVYEGIDKEGGLCYEYDPKHGLTKVREWWPQAEAVVGFLNAYQISKEEKYLDSAWKSCQIIKKYFIDHKFGEWFFRVDENGKPVLSEDKVGFWKCPYHNSRMAFEVKERLKYPD
jgi:mannobiose 2-epimerase